MEVERRLTQKGQVTIPAELRRRLGLKARDRVWLTVEDGALRLTPVPSVVDRSFGIIEPRQRPDNWTAVREEFERLVAEEVMRADQPT